MTILRPDPGRQTLLTAPDQPQPSLASQPARAVEDKSLPRGNRRTGFLNLESLIVGLVLIIAVAFNLYQLYPEVAIKVPMLNDGVLHLINLQRTVDALRTGQDPTDNWLGTIAMGYPLFHHYQHLPYLLPALLYVPLQGVIQLADVLRWITYLLLSLFPLSIYWSMRRFGFARLPSALAGLVASLVATNGLYGLEYGSYVWRGYGMYTQLWGMFLLPMALAQCYVTLEKGRGYFWSVLLLAATVLSHVVLGYIALGSVVLLALLGYWRRPALGSEYDCVWDRVKRLVLLLLLVALVTAYFLVPFVQDSTYLNRSVWEKTDKYDSYGYAWVLGTLVKGGLFDEGRFPSLTILAGLGLVLCLWRWRDARCRVLVALPVLWLLLYFGRPTWGVLLNLLPMGRDLQLHRLIAGVHLGGIFLMGIGLALPWNWALARRDVRAVLAVAALTALVLYPVYRERAAYMEQNARWMSEQQAAQAAEEKDISGLIAALKKLPPGRVYAGLAAKWGKDYKVGSVPMYALLNSGGLDMLGFLYHSLSLNSDVQVLFDDALQEQYNLFIVRYVVVPTDWTVPKYYTALQDFGRHRLYQIETTGYLDLVGSDLAFAGDKSEFYPAASRWLASDQVRFKQHPIVNLEGVTAGDPQFYPLSQAAEVISRATVSSAPARGTIVSETVESNAYQASVQVIRNSTLMLKATYHPDWHATVDGVEVPIVMVMPSYVGVKLGPGGHQVRFEYRPPPVRGLLQVVSLLTLVAVGLADWRPKWRAGLARRLKLEHLAALANRWTASPATVVEHRVRQIAATRPSLWLKGHLPHAPYLGGVALVALLVGLPLFQFKQMSGHDALEYLPRNAEFYQGLMEGELLPRWAPDLSGGYGEPFFNFNPPLIYYVSALFHRLGFTLIAAEDLACFALLLLAGLGMYLLAGEFFGRRGGLVSAAAFLLAPYMLVTLYVRHALADFSALALVPLALWGLYRFATGGRYPFLLAGAASFALIMLGSNPVALITVPTLILFLGCLAWFRRSARVLLRGSWCVALGLGLAAFFWLPTLSERNLVHTQRLLETFLNYRNHFATLWQLVYSPWGYGVSLPGPGDGMSFAIGPVHLVLAGAALLLIRRIRATCRGAGLLVGFSLVLVLLAAFFSVYESQFVWDRLPLLQYLEYPWRFLTLAALGTGFLCGFPFLFVATRQNRLANILMVTLIGGLLVLNLSHARPETFYATKDSDYSPEIIAAKGLAVNTVQEYEPIWVQERPQTPAQEPLTFLQGQGRVLAARLTPAAREFVVEVAQAARLRLNTFYFPGWALYVDGIEQPVSYSNPQGVIEFSLEQGQHGVKFVFANTPIRQWSSRLSWLALFLLVFSPWIETLVEPGRKMLSALYADRSHSFRR